MPSQTRTQAPGRRPGPGLPWRWADLSPCSSTASLFSANSPHFFWDALPPGISVQARPPGGPSCCPHCSLGQATGPAGMLFRLGPRTPCEQGPADCHIPSTVAQSLGPEKEGTGDHTPDPHKPPLPVTQGSRTPVIARADNRLYGNAIRVSERNMDGSGQWGEGEKKLVRVPGRSPRSPLGRMEVTFHPHQAWPLFVVSPQTRSRPRSASAGQVGPRRASWQHMSQAANLSLGPRGGCEAMTSLSLPSQLPWFPSCQESRLDTREPHSHPQRVTTRWGEGDSRR